MKHLVFFDFHQDHLSMLPLSFTKPIAKIRIGIWTIEEKWKNALESNEASYKTENYLAEKFQENMTSKEKYFIRGSVLPCEELIVEINKLQLGESIVCKGEMIAGYGTDDHWNTCSFGAKECSKIPTVIKRHWDVFQNCGKAISYDFDRVTKGRSSLRIPDSNQILGDYPIFLEEGAQVEASVLNAKNGPIYIGKNAEIMEGCLVRGPFVLGESGVLKMGAKIYGPTAIGKYSKIGGEVNNSVILDYSNKGHDGFLGNSVIGEWCNLGADTNTSNLKNNYGEVKVWDYLKNELSPSGLQFCGLAMGDFSKSSINSMFNTGTSIGVCSNIFGHGFPPKYVSSFAWGGFNDESIFQLEKAFEAANRMMERRGLSLTDVEKKILSYLSENRK